MRVTLYSQVLTLIPKCLELLKLPTCSIMARRQCRLFPLTGAEQWSMKSKKMPNRNQNGWLGKSGRDGERGWQGEELSKQNFTGHGLMVFCHGLHFDFDCLSFHFLYQRASLPNEVTWKTNTADAASWSFRSLLLPLPLMPLLPLPLRLLRGCPSNAIEYPW